MRRYGVPIVGIALSALLAITYMAQRETHAASGLVLQQKFPNHTSWVYTADFDDNEELVASGGVDGLRVWRMDSAREVHHRPGAIFLIRFLKDGSLLCADAYEGVLLLDPKTWQVQKCFGQKAVKIVAAVTESGDKIAASFSVAEVDHTKPPMSHTKIPISFEIHVWQLVEMEWRESILRGHQGPVNGLAFHPRAPYLVSYGEDSTTRVWDLSSSKQIDQIGDSSPLTLDREIPQGRSSCVFSPSGDRLFVNGRIWDYAKHDEKPIRKSTAKKLGGQNAMFSPNGRWIATGYPDGTLHLWDAKTLAEKAVVNGSINGSPLTEVRFSRSGKLIVTAGKGIVPLFSAMEKKVKSDDTVVRVWRVNIPE
jgi:WD40 repeat protein